MKNRLCDLDEHHIGILLKFDTFGAVQTYEEICMNYTDNHMWTWMMHYLQSLLDRGFLELDGDHYKITVAGRSLQTLSQQFDIDPTEGKDT